MSTQLPTITPGYDMQFMMIGLEKVLEAKIYHTDFFGIQTVLRMRAADTFSLDEKKAFCALGQFRDFRISTPMRVDDPNCYEMHIIFRTQDETARNFVVRFVPSDSTSTFPLTLVQP